MRTTVTLDPDVETLVKSTMRKRDASFKQVLNEGLRAGLGRHSKRSVAPFKQMTFHMGQPIVDLTKATAFASELEDLELLSKLKQGR